jgi:hypothetical protein
MPVAFAIITRPRYRDIANSRLDNLNIRRFRQQILNRHAIQLAIGLSARAMNRRPA